MYRPNRIGPWHLCHIDQAPKTGTMHADTETTDLLFKPAVPDTTIRTLSASRHFQVTTPAIDAQKQCAVGVAVKGDNPLGELTDINASAVIYTVSGHCRILDGTGVGPPNFGNLMFGVGRNVSGSLTELTAGANPCDNWMLVPCDALMQGQNVQHASINTQVLIGNFDAGVTYKEEPIIFAWIIHNGSNAASNTFRVACSISVLKYTEDHLTLDPPRTM